MIFLLLLFSLSLNLDSQGAEAKIGYGSSLSAVNAKTQESVYMGFELGLKRTLKVNSVTNLLLTAQSSQSTELAAQQAARTLVDQGAIAIFGFTGSHDSMVAGKELKKDDILTVFPGSNLDEIASIGEHIYTTGQPMTVEVSHTLRFLSNKFASKKGLMVINPTAIPSVKGGEIARSYILDPKHNLHLDFSLMQKDKTIKNDELNKIKEGHYSFLYISSYPEAAMPFVAQLDQAGIDIPIILGASWAIGDADLLRRFIAKRKSDVFITSGWYLHSKTSKLFKNDFKSTYGKDPTAANQIGYDLGVIAGRVILRAKATGKYSKKGLIEIFSEIKCFDKLAVGKLCFNGKQGHADARTKFFKVRINDLVELTEY